MTQLDACLDTLDPVKADWARSADVEGYSYEAMAVRHGVPLNTTLVAAVKVAGLVETLSGEGPFTVFAPTNDAFAKLPAATVDTLLKPENKDQLTKILTCHVVAANAMSDAIGKMIADDNGTEAKVTIADIAQSNGVIHVIDTVVLPKM